MRTEAPKWNRMDKGEIQLERLLEEYLLVCRTEGKSPKTLHGYRQQLERFCRWLHGNLSDFTLHSARAYVGELQRVKKYEGHPFNPVHDEGLSSQTIKGHVVVLKGFATWLWEEDYTDENVLRKLKTPKASKKVMTTLTEAETSKILSCIERETVTGFRNEAVILLLLDTGLRCAELVGLQMEDLFLRDQCLKVMGKGQKERIVPFGDRTARALLRYLNLRPDANGCGPVFLNKDGSPLTENAVKMVFERLANKAGIPRLHIHLLRHTFATNYLLSGENPIKLQRILGHETLEMTRRYVDMVAVQVAVMEHRQSPVDRMHLRYPGRIRARS
ncbi:MAG: tyrosine-type recombinase/integrase [Dehalococcoidia bacterium]